MYCNRCGAAMPDNASFCTMCGKGLRFENFTPNAPYMPPPKPKKNNAALIIAIIAGSVCLVAALLFVLGIFQISGSDRDSERGTVYEDERPREDEETNEDEETREDEEAYNEDEPYVTAGEVEPDVEGYSPSPDVEEYSPSDSELIDYFCEVALNVEYGSADHHLKRWSDPLRVKVTGDYTSEDYATLEDHIDTLNGLGMLPDISIVDSNENYSIYFLPLDEMGDVIPGYVEGNWGYFYLYWDTDYNITDVYMGIATDVTDQEDRNHLILEEFTQSLGLMSDSDKYEDSIFQSEWTETQSLTNFDYTLVYMLYSDYLTPGMEESDVRGILGG